MLPFYRDRHFHFLALFLKKRLTHFCILRKIAFPVASFSSIAVLNPSGDLQILAADHEIHTVTSLTVYFFWKRNGCTAASFMS